MPTLFAVSPPPPLRSVHSLSNLYPISLLCGWNIARAGIRRVKLFSSIDVREWQRRQTLICAVNQDAEESFKKTVEVDKLIDTLKVANSNELQQLVVENVLAFNESFWLRLAARTDTCKSEDDKAWFSTWLILYFNVFLNLVPATEKIDSSTDVLKEILKPVVDEVEETPWPPRDPEALKLMQKEINQREQEGQLDEGFLSEVNAQLRECSEPWFAVDVWLVLLSFASVRSPGTVADYLPEMYADSTHAVNGALPDPLPPAELESS
ncbi:hypothetical protein Acr_10g0003580 [Actinidia rufa]|uniref:Uncharacterized protein n=1 Tax=Actinidia rufa TaxID=165716 RepID=A0A7J0F8N8_9ERIC|nr:hypothetical protein Acr_10g0003580 [Actinidia rufa]